MKEGTELKTANNMPHVDLISDINEDIRKIALLLEDITNDYPVGDIHMGTAYCQLAEIFKNGGQTTAETLPLLSWATEGQRISTKLKMISDYVYKIRDLSDRDNASK